MDVPFNIKIGSLIEFDPTIFITNDMEIPDGCSVTAIGQMSEEGFKFYIKSLDGREFVIFYQNEQAMLCGVLDTIQPTNEEEIGEWLDPESGHIGQTSFEIDDVAYLRMVLPENAEKIDPIEQAETLFDKGGKKVYDNYSMFYHHTEEDKMLVLEAIEGDESFTINLFWGIELPKLTFTVI